MSILRTSITAALLLGACLVAPPAAPAKGRDPAQAITSQLICPCSCGEVLSGCTCDTGKSMQAFVEGSLKNGKTKDQVVGALVAQYGEVIRGAPKAQGFNLVVWVAPFAATLAGLAMAFFVLRRWVGRRPAAADLAGASMEARGAYAPGRPPEGDLAALRARVEAELRQIRD